MHKKEDGHISSVMYTSFISILISIYLSNITCTYINNIAKLLPAHGSNMDIMVSEITRVVTEIEQSRFGKASFINIILPKMEKNTNMPDIMEKTAQKLGTTWLVTTNDGFCCDSYELRVMVPIKPTVVEHTPDFYIIPLRKHNGLNYLDAQLTLMSEENSFNPRAIFLLITLTHQCGDFKGNNVTALYFDHMWAKNCMSLVILVLSECDFRVTIVTANPFSDDNTCRTVQENGTKQYHSNKWHDEEIDFSIYKTNHKNFNKCQFSVGAIPSPPYLVGKPDANETVNEFVGGIDLELLNLASTINNFTFVFDVRHGYDTDAMAKILPNGSIVGMFIDILQKNLDICVGGIIPSDYNYYRYDYSGYYKFSYFGWVVNDARLAPQWKIFFGAFSKPVWIISVFVFLITSFLYSFLDSFSRSYSTENHLGCIKNVFLMCNFRAMPLIEYFSITLGLSSLLKPISPCLRVLYFSWSIYSLHMCIAYSSMLFLLISNPPFEKEITTVEDLKISGLKVGSKRLVFQRFAVVELDSTTRDIIDNHFDCPMWESCIEDLIIHRNFSLLIMQDMLEYYVDTKQSKVHRISEALISYGASVMTSKGNPLSLGFNKLVVLALQSGLVEKWGRNTKSKIVSNIKDGIKGSDKSATTLTISDLKGSFIVLVSGMVMSSLLMFGELMIGYLQKKWVYDK